MPDNRPVAPQLLSPRGVYEDSCWAISGGFALKAIDAMGRCVDFAIVHTVGEYERELDRLGRVLDATDPPMDGREKLLAEAARRRSASVPSVARGLRLESTRR